MGAESVRAERFAVFSDVHLGRPGAGYACELGDAQLVELIQHLLDTHDVVIANGDIYDLDRGTLPLRFGHELSVLQRAHRDVALRLEDPRVVLTTGNHDRIATGRKIVRGVDVDTPTGIWRVEHGHRFDSWIKQRRTFTSVVTWGSGYLAKPPLRPLFGMLRKVDRLLTGEGKGICPIRVRAESWLSGSKYAGLVLGHTHQVYVDTVGDRIIANPGDCMTAPAGYLSVDGRRGTVRAMQWEHGVDRVVAEALANSPT